VQKAKCNDSGKLNYFVEFANLPLANLPLANLPLALVQSLMIFNSIR